MRVGDLLPAVSGASHLGINGDGFGGFDITSIRPFGHAFMLSGVFMDPKTGQSGVLRFSQDADAFQFSTDGGLTFADMGAGGSLPNTCFSAPFTSIVGATFTHNLNVTDVIVQLRDSGGNVIVPDEITVVDANNVFVAFTSPQTGRITIVSCGGDNGLKDVYYRGGNTVLIDTSTVVTGDPDITLVTGNRKFILATQGSRFPINISGIFAFPGSSHQLGDLAVYGHSRIHPWLGTLPTSQAEATARALGPGTMVLNTGSGQINLMTGSGIAMFGGGFENPNVPLFIHGRQRVPLQTVLLPDTMIIADGNFSGVRFMAPGLYRVDYQVGVEKIAGTTGRTFACWAILVNKGNEAQFPQPNPMPQAVSGSISYTTVNNTTTLTNNTMSATFLVNADVDQFMALEVTTMRAVAAGQDVTIVGSGTTCIVQYIGPRRTGY